MSKSEQPKSKDSSRGHKLKLLNRFLIWFRNWAGAKSDKWRIGAILVSGAYGAFLYFLLSQLPGASLQEFQWWENAPFLNLFTHFLFGATAAALSVFMFTKTSLQDNFLHGVCLAVISGMIWPLVFDRAITQVSGGYEGGNALRLVLGTEKHDAAKAGDIEEYIALKKLNTVNREETEADSEQRVLNESIEELDRTRLSNAVVAKIENAPDVALNRQLARGFEENLFTPEAVLLEPLKTVLSGGDLQNRTKTIQVIEEGIESWSEHNADNLAANIQFYGQLGNLFAKYGAVSAETEWEVAGLEQRAEMRFSELCAMVKPDDADAVKLLTEFSTGGSGKVKEVASTYFKKLTAGVAGKIAVAASVGDGATTAGVDEHGTGGEDNHDNDDVHMLIVKSIETLIGEANKRNLADGRKLHFRFQLNNALTRVGHEDFSHSDHGGIAGKIKVVLDGNLKMTRSMKKLEAKRQLSICYVNEQQGKLAEKWQKMLNNGGDWYCREIVTIDEWKAPPRSQVRYFDNSGVLGFSDTATIAALLKKLDLEKIVTPLYVKPHPNMELYNEGPGRFEIWLSADFKLAPR